MNSRERICGSKTSSKYSRQKQQNDEDSAKRNGNDAYGTQTKSYRHQHIWIETGGKTATDVNFFVVRGQIFWGGGGVGGANDIDLERK